MSQCSSNPCELRESQKQHVHVFGFDPVSNPVAPVLGNRWHRFWETGGTGFVSAGPMASFENSVAPVLGNRWHRFSLEFATASFGKSGVSGVFPGDSGF
jgi:hypothetical protein